jgi:predicted enzyme related to lactoylglutathione lyase
MSGINKLILSTILVNNLDEALDFYCNKLGFVKKHDLQRKNERWLTIAPKNQREIEFVLRTPHANMHELVIKEMNKTIGKGTLFTFSTNDLDSTFQDLKKKGVNFIHEPIFTVEGKIAIFEDLDGNRFSLLEIV